jgi:hypothetical protein
MDRNMLTNRKNRRLWWWPGSTTGWWSLAVNAGVDVILLSDLAHSYGMMMTRKVSLGLLQRKLIVWWAWNIILGW